MIRAERLHHLLKEIKKLEKDPLINIWRNIFEVESIIDVYDRLSNVKHEIDTYELELQELKLNTNKQFQRIVTTLNSIVMFPNLNATIINQQYMKNENINMTFAAFDIFNTIVEAEHISIEDEDNIPDDELDRFKTTLEDAIRAIEDADIPSEDKVIFLSIFHDLYKGLSLYHVSGLKGFVSIVLNNLCKIQMIDNNSVQKTNKQYEMLRQLTKKVVGTVWVWTLTYMKKRVYALLESEAIQFLDAHASEWANLSLLNDSSKDEEGVIDAEIDDG